MGHARTFSSSTGGGGRLGPVPCVATPGSPLNLRGCPPPRHTAPPGGAHIVPTLSTGCVWCGAALGPSVAPRPYAGGQLREVVLSDPSDLLSDRGTPRGSRGMLRVDRRAGRQQLLGS